MPRHGGRNAGRHNTAHGHAAGNGQAGHPFGKTDHHHHAHKAKRGLKVQHPHVRFK